jgi:hypothetical protein
VKRFAGLALVGLFAIGWPLTADAAPVDLRISLELGASECVASIDQKKTAFFSKQDVLVFSFINNCPTKQEVFVCVRDTTGTTYAEPWRQCEAFPKSTPATVGKQFQVDGKGAEGPGTAYAICSVSWPPLNSSGTFTKEKYCLQVFTKPENSYVKCPKPEFNCPTATRGSELALEVEP